MRKIRIAPGEHYHVFNRAVNKQVIFHDTNDYVRFLFLIIHFQSVINFPQIGRLVKNYVKSLAFDTGEVKNIIKQRTIELVGFCIMPNHFHLIIKELEEGGIAAYMHRVMTAYAKYYSIKYQKSGHVFQGTYQAVHIQNDLQMLHLSAYVHRNPREISRWFNKEDQYEWSSYQDLILKDRWDGLLTPDVILGEFKDRDGYRHFVKTSPAKLLKGELNYLEELSKA
jgi:putative transposase